MPFDLKRWNECACGCRSLLELLSRKQDKIIAPEDFYNQYYPAYQASWKDTPGGTNTAMLCELAVKLTLAGDVDTFVDPDKLIAEWANPLCYGMLLQTERWPTEGNFQLLGIKYHTMLATKISQNGFAVWNPISDGKAHEAGYSWLRWHQWMMRGLVLYRSP